MKNAFAKISLLFVFVVLLNSCNTTRKIPKGKFLLTKNEFVVNKVNSKSEDLINLPYQKPNSKILGYRFRLFLNNLAIQNPDSVYKSKFINDPEKYKRKAWFLSKKQVDRLGKSFYYYGVHNFLKNVGEPAVIVDERRAQKTLLRLQSYYYNKGFFDVKASYKIDTISKNKIKLKYDISTNQPYLLDTIDIKIQTPELDSIYKKYSGNSFLKKEQYNVNNIDNERGRVTNIYRNNGVYYFQQNFITFDIDTINTKKKVNLDLIINDRETKTQDTSKTEHFKIFKINKVNIFTDALSAKKSNQKIDSTSYKNFNLYSTGKLKYRPKAITDAVFITKGSLFADNKTVLTTQYLSNLRIFNYPTIQYVVDKNDTIHNSLIANIYLVQRKKYGFRTSFDLTRSNIQLFGIAATTSVSIRNVFRGAEIFEIGARGNLGSSKDLANPDNRFFNISEIGLDTKLIFPRILFPFNTDRIIPKTMIPSTFFSVGFAKQQNIGLDKQNFTGSLTYNWTPSRNKTMRFDLFNVQFVKNVNTSNYYNVYKSSYNVLNEISRKYVVDPNYYDSNKNLNIDSGTTNFTNDVLTNGLVVVNQTDFKSISSIEERRKRLTQNDLIFASSLSYSQTSKKNLDDENYFSIKTKLESAGNLLSLISKSPLNANGNQLLNNFFGVNYSQYLKTEFEYIKHWDLRGKKVLAFRSFTGIAVPYGNSKSIPFSRSYFAGGSNDNRAWQAYSLGPGKTGAINDFNEANLKIALSAELRFNIFNKFNGAIFADAGNIWNVLDNVQDENSKFIGFKSLEDLSLGSGFGLRYDFNFFVIRFDFGFKTYDPAITNNKKWFRDYNFSHSVINIGINYPF
ncbi:MAG: BamA/TamA family outer membrane protein [Flavobacterium sp.]|nr:BamA/TamA family outer membrane protein [Flavobacterium sp.]